ncbi:hypothetical protein ASG88_11315 [Nocardioides sp. Soil777]|uniref:nuclear transport factor 2 family protein n=1 Tax=Nocardioides sp. Soil777 TaxID=1736409 RepID=UPI0007038BD4|nr:nuclear transport factor 2 family protein [Nocardioides sp. Soil777]KRF00980.1 hypothetical protein ASG88_11315 [Nocardioides sp. Soil777]
MESNEGCETCGGGERDRYAINDLITAYAQAIDDKRAEDVSALFAPECVFRVFKGDKGEARGRAGVSVLVERVLSTFTATSHHVSNVRIDLTGPDSARATTYLHAWHRFVEDRPDGLLWARYEDELVRHEDRWLFAQRTLRVTGEQDFAFLWITAGA